MKKAIINTVIASCLLLVQARAQKIDISSAKKLVAFNRSVSVESVNGKNIVHLSASANDGLAWIKDKTFKTGTIEFDVKGKDILQQSFVGIAFHGLNDSTFDCVYFRPFNFNSSDGARQSHSVQYISMPQYDWQYLREHSPGIYEHSLTGKVGAETWFHVKVTIADNSIEVFVNGDSTASLSVKPLNNYKTGKIGFWVGNNSDGDFSNLVVYEQ